MVSPREEDKSENPFYPFMLVETNLGIPIPVVHHVLAAASAEFMDNKGKLREDRSKLELSSRVLFMINPEHSTAANTRKQLIQEEVIDGQSELHLINLMFTIPRHSKSAIAWHHRKWLREFVERSTGSSFDIESERKICERTATIYPRNYYSWVYRHNLLKLMASDTAALKTEYNWSRAWVESHISDHTGIQHLERCLIMTGLEFDIIEHWSWTADNIKRYPGHEALWCHLRFCSHFAASRRKLLADSIVTFIQECMEECDRATGEEGVLLQKQLASRYSLWVARLAACSSQVDASSKALLVKTSLIYVNELMELDDHSKFYDDWSTNTFITKIDIK
ncbi:hypothetical protein INT43_001710 [Umbelopsis isabellina]|uniref:Uncharacterized protein n=1 Tax=Mortierella isabellina TaxID=91625 RepID=A0A8H7PSR9_MORIS|nr:hypothetical protein INT43_001710 [Umbelopsis isabellina]